MFIEQASLFESSTGPVAVNNTPSLDEIKQKFENKEIKGFKSNVDGEKFIFRLFISTSANGDRILCFFNKGSSRKGSILRPFNIFGFVRYIPCEMPKPKDDGDELFKLVAKYRKYAEKATFTNNFIRSCLSAPKTKEEWIEKGSKSPYDLTLCTGTSIDGKIISLDAIAKTNPHVVASFKSFFERKCAYRSGRFDFRGYEATLSIEIRDNGDMCGYLNVEYKGCLNGYYYLLVNDENFIGYDID